MSRYSYEFKRYRKGKIIILHVNEHFSSLDTIHEHRFYCKYINNQYEFELYTPYKHNNSVLDFIINENIGILKEKRNEYYGNSYTLSLSSKSLLQIV